MNWELILGPLACKEKLISFARHIDLNDQLFFLPLAMSEKYPGYWFSVMCYLLSWFGYGLGSMNS